MLRSGPAQPPGLPGALPQPARTARGPGSERLGKTAFLMLSPPREGQGLWSTCSTSPGGLTTVLSHLGLRLKAAGGLKLRDNQGFDQDVCWQWDICSPSLSLRLRENGKMGSVSSKPHVWGPEVICACPCPPR